MEPITPALDLLTEVGTRISATDPLHEVLNEIVEFVTDFVSCDSCFIYVLEQDKLVLRASKNSHPEVLDRLTIPLGLGITGWVAENREPVILDQSAPKDPRFCPYAELPEDTYESFLSIPVVLRGRLIAVINVQHKDVHNFSGREIKAISAIGHLVGAAIEMARLENEVSELSDKLAVRKIVERAKGILQRDMGISEEEAYGILQKEARSRRIPMKEVAQAILLTSEVKRSRAEGEAKTQ
ncbi:MAG TPA: GAF domain-containing protein [Terriglobales bacterium]|nr:GAF domain-containing protein [Terriglobales bacterium]